MQQESSPFEKDINDCQVKYSAGDKLMLFVAILRCAQYKLPLPDWIRWELEAGMHKFIRAEAYEFGEAFGISREKYFRKDAEQKKSQLAFKVFRMVRDLHEKEGRGIHQALFDYVGKEFGISGSTARDYYYEVQNELSG